jgi:8-oxo-dGTP pyrophosphatase MutT (NUDIX family)
MNDFKLINIAIEDAEKLASIARHKSIHTLIGGLIVHSDGRLFSQRRSLTRNFGPGWWDNVGGHVEGDETLRQALTREITEETGWQLDTILRVVAERTWHDPRGISHEWIVLATITGDLDNPVLETAKVDKTAWIDHSNTELLTEHRAGDASQSDIYQHALTILANLPH